MSKLCKKCGQVKSLSKFANCKSKVDGKYLYCKECVNKYKRILYATNADYREKTKKSACTYNRDRYSSDPEYRAKRKTISDKHRRSRYITVEGRAQAILKGAMQRDPCCTVTFDHIITGIKKGVCPVTGIQFDLTDKHQRMSGRYRNPYSPSIDRINPKLGYTNENTRIVITQYNIMKGDLTDYELFFICLQVITRNGNA